MKPSSGKHDDLVLDEAQPHLTGAADHLDTGTKRHHTGEPKYPGVARQVGLDLAPSVEGEQEEVATEPKRLNSGKLKYPGAARQVKSGDDEFNVNCDINSDINYFCKWHN